MVLKPVEMILSREDIAKLVSDIGGQISTDMKDLNPLFLVVLKGAVVFAADLMRVVSVPINLDFINARCYGNSMEPGNIWVDIPEEIIVKDRYVVIIEDIIDTGTTLRATLDKLKNRNPKDIVITSLLSKPERRKFDVPIDYLGFEVPNTFIVGYGMDFAEKFRRLPDIMGLEEI